MSRVEKTLIGLPPEDKAKLQALADEKAMPLSVFLRSILREWLKEHEAASA